MNHDRIASLLRQIAAEIDEPGEAHGAPSRREVAPQSTNSPKTGTNAPPGMKGPQIGAQVTDEPPIGSVVRDRDGDTWERIVEGYWELGAEVWLSWSWIVHAYGPLTLVSLPEPIGSVVRDREDHPVTGVEYGGNWATVHDLPDPRSAWAIGQNQVEWRDAMAYVGLDCIWIFVEDQQTNRFALHEITPKEAESLATWLLAAAHYIRTERTDR